ncbi:MAG: membrane protein insertion efficiency factor YidD [Pirellulaceae bacterium]|nr:membrane protein insertion efficiency factor YidD [Pirellulaceae bacterium]
MSNMRQQAASGERPLSSLRQSLKQPQIWLGILLVLIGAAVVDTWRSPSNQVGAVVYIRLVRVYQTVCSPHLNGYIRCRYVPTCSEYSIQAVQDRGLITGLRLTAERISRCRTSVPLGTPDPVPGSSDSP